MKRLLLVSYYYPPLAGPGVFRPLRLSKHLPACGWDVTVLSVDARVRVLKDPELVREVPDAVRVERTRSLEMRDPLIALSKLGLKRFARGLERWLDLPDGQRGWVPFAVRRARALLRDVPHDVVLTTSSPYSAHLVGRALKRATKIPWIADFRDEWTTNPYIRFPTRWHRRVHEGLERRVLAEADRVVSVSGPWTAALRGQAPDENATKFLVMPNGYDADHFPAVPSGRPDRFRVVYTGSFYGPRSPRAFFDGLRLVVGRGRVPANEIEVLLVGHTGEAGSLAAPEGVPVSIVEQRPYFESLDHLARAAVLLLVIPPEGGAGNHTGKLFQYLAARRPILALAPEPNVAADLVRETRSGVVAPTDDPEAIALALELLHSSWKGGHDRLADQDREAIARYEARAQARDWARLLDDLVGAPGRDR